MELKRLLPLIGSLCLVMILTVLLLPACAAEAPAPAPTPTPTPTPKPTPTPTPPPAAWEWPDKLLIGTCDVGGTDHTAVSALAPILEKSTGMKVRVIPDANEQRRTYDALQGTIDIVTHSGSDLDAYIRGFAGGVIYPKKPVGFLWQLVASEYVFYTPADSDIKSIYDIKEMTGVRIATVPDNAAVTMTVQTCLPAFLGMSEEDVKEHIVWVPSAGWSAHCRAPIEGKADVAYIAISSALAYEIEANPRGIRPLSWPIEDKEGWSRVLDIKSGVLPAKLSLGIETALGHEFYRAPKIVDVSADFDDELGYQLAKWLHENYDAYKDAHITLSSAKMNFVRDYLDYNSFPVHAGAVRYLKDVGVWTPDDDIWNKEAREKVAKYVAASDAAWAEAEAKGIKVAVDNQEWIDLWASYIKDLPSFKFRVE